MDEYTEYLTEAEAGEIVRRFVWNRGHRGVTGAEKELVYRELKHMAQCAKMLELLKSGSMEVRGTVDGSLRFAEVDMPRIRRPQSSATIH